MTASEWGLGVGVRERRRAEVKTEPIHEANKEGCAWARGWFCKCGEKNHITGDRKK